MNDWFAITNSPEIASPALLIYPERVRENIRRMIAMTGGTDRLRPHIKTHKMPDVMRLKLEAGIRKFKCATMAEAEMAAQSGAPDVLLAYPPVGPNVQRLIELVQRFPNTKFSTVADDASAIRALSKAFSEAALTLDLLLDVDCGQHRTGIEAGTGAVELYRLINSLPGLRQGGLHVYDGHIHEADLPMRTAMCEAAFEPVHELRRALASARLSVPRVVAGGTPTFPLHAANADLECSPGTCVLWDFGYSSQFRDLDFLLAAVVFTRVVSKPGGNRLCLDLGYKAVASENPPPRVQFLNLPDATAVSHSEEHLVVETPRAPEFAVGDCLYGIPRHVCPTVALYSEAATIRNGRAEEYWKITARERRLTI